MRTAGNEISEMSLFRHTSYNVIGAVIPIIVSLVTVPLYLQVIGLDRYGVLTLAWVIVGYFSFFDFGLGRATSQQIAASGEAADARNRAFWTGMILSIGFSVAALAVATPIIIVVLRSMKTGSSEIRGEVFAALPALIAGIPVSLIYSVLRGTLEGRSSFFVLNAILSIGSAATGVLPLVTAIMVGPQIPQLVNATLLVRIVMLVALAAAAAHAVPLGRPLKPRRADVRKMLRFGFWFTVSNVIGPIMALFDRFLIGALIGTTAVALYVVPFNLISQLLLIPAGLSTALFPRFAADADSKRANKNELVRATAFLLTPMAFAAVVVVGPFLDFWVGVRTAQHSTPIAYLLMVGFWANGVAQLPFVGLQAAGKTDVGAKVHLAEVAPYLVLLWGGVIYFGLLGAAFAWTLRGVADLLALAILDRISPVVLRSVVVDLAILTLAAIAMLVSPSEPLIRWSTMALIATAMVANSLANVPSIVLHRVRPWLPRSGAHLR